MKKIIIGILICILLLNTGCAPKLLKASQSKELLGANVEITILDNNYTKAKNSIQKAFQEIERVDKIINIDRENSQVSILNEKKALYNVSPDLLDVLQKARYLYDISNGSFDITVQPLLEFYGEVFDNGEEPSSYEVNEILKKVDMNKVYFDKNMVGISDTKITLNGLLKGYAIDKAIQILKKEGIKHALVNANGDLRAIGKKTEGENWQIALQNPRNPLHFITILMIDDKAVATSGDYTKYFDKEIEYHHIINPKTGYSATELISVTIMADSAMEADGLATTVFALGKKKGIELIESLNVEGIIITRTKEIIRSSGLS